MPDMNEKLRAKIAEWRAAAKKWGDYYFISGSERSRIISSCLTERADEIESLLDAPEPPASVAGDEYDAGAREWFGQSTGFFTEDGRKGHEELVTTLAAHFRAACGSRESELETALRSLRNEISGALSITEQGIIDAIGVTNLRCLQLKIEQADDVLAARAKQGKETPA